MTPEAERVLARSIDYVAYRLGFEMHSFRGDILRAVAHADPANRERLRAAFPEIVDAWEAWMAAPDGIFEPPPRTPTPVKRLQQAILLFHSAEPWDEERQRQWQELTGRREATTKVLCDLARGIMP